jgi:hypothetical protein
MQIRHANRNIQTFNPCILAMTIHPSKSGLTLQKSTKCDYQQSCQPKPWKNPVSPAASKLTRMQASSLTTSLGEDFTLNAQRCWQNLYLLSNALKKNDILSQFNKPHTIYFANWERKRIHWTRRPARLTWQKALVGRAPVDPHEVPQEQGRSVRLNVTPASRKE